jgi:hypothetical protein
MTTTYQQYSFALAQETQSIPSPEAERHPLHSFTVYTCEVLHVDWFNINNVEALITNFKVP